MDSCKTPETYEHGSPSRKRSEPTTTVTDVHPKKKSHTNSSDHVFFFGSQIPQIKQQEQKKKRKRNTRVDQEIRLAISVSYMPQNFHTNFTRLSLAATCDLA
jgi:hypothetical protein